MLQAEPAITLFILAHCGPSGVRYIAEQNCLPRAGDTVGIQRSTSQAFPRQPGEQHSFNPVRIQSGRSLISTHTVGISKDAWFSRGKSHIDNNNNKNNCMIRIN